MLKIRYFVTGRNKIHTINGFNQVAISGKYTVSDQTINITEANGDTGEYPIYNCLSQLKKEMAMKGC
jgi:hypothetical protein